MSSDYVSHHFYCNILLVSVSFLLQIIHNINTYLLPNFDNILWLKRQSNLVLDSDKRHYEYYY